LGAKGYVIAIKKIEYDKIVAGLIDNDTGAVNVSVEYKAIIFRPFTNEVVDAVVTTTSDEVG
jgi:DNA-directed RNA polymerase II subunit RPB7